MTIIRSIRGEALPLLVALALSPASISAVAQTNVQRVVLFRANRLFGMTVENSDGQVLGKLEDFVLDLDSARPAYAIVVSGGFFGLRAQSIIVPAELLSAATALRNTLALDVPKSRWKDAPRFRRSELASLAEPVRAFEIDQFYRQANSDQHFKKPASVRSPILHSTGNALKKHHRWTGENGKKLVLASAIIGTEVVDRQHEHLGRILDLLLGFDGAPVFALVSSGRLFHGVEFKYAASLRVLAREDTGQIKMDADRPTLEQAPEFPRQVWPNLGSNAPMIFRYKTTKDDYGQNQLTRGPASS